MRTFTKKITKVVKTYTANKDEFWSRVFVILAFIEFYLALQML